MYIKESNYWAIQDAFLLKNDKKIQGSKLEALDKLIQSKGEIFELESVSLKALDLGNGTYIAMEVTQLKSNSFFPCRVKKYYLQKSDSAK